MTDNLDELKRQWQRLSTRIDNLEETNRALSERLAKSKVTSMQERLANRINNWAGLGFLLPLMAPLLHSAIGLPWWVCIVYALFGIIMAFLSYRFVKFIRTDRLIELPVSNAIRKATAIKIRQERIRLAGICMGIFVICSIYYCIPEQHSEIMSIGFSVGLAGGLAIGIPRAITNHRLARRLVESLKES